MISAFRSTNYFAQRAQFLLEVSEGKLKHISEIRADFSRPEVGWIDMDLYVDGIQTIRINCSDVFDPFIPMRDWLTDIITGEQPLAQLIIDEEGSDAILTFEEYGVDIAGKSTDDFNNRIQLGLLTAYETADDTMPIKILVSTRQLVSAIYLGLLTYAATFSFDSLLNSFSYNWEFRGDNEDIDEENPEFIKKGQWNFYNKIKSPKLEWFLYDSWANWRDYDRIGNTNEEITGYILMRAESGGGLFWNGERCGNADSINIDGKEIDLTDIEGLRQWYEEFERHATENMWEEEKFNDWLKRGRELAFKIRKNLPASINLFYYSVPFKHGIKNLPAVMDLIPNFQIKKYQPL